VKSSLFQYDSGVPLRVFVGIMRSQDGVGGQGVVLEGAHCTLRREIKLESENRRLCSHCWRFHSN